MDQDYEFAKIKIIELLGDGEWHATEELRWHMCTNGISKKVFRKARHDLGIVTRNNGNGTWDWRM